MFWKLLCSIGNKFYVRYGKRTIDLFFSVLALLFLFPIFLLISILIKLEDGGSIFYVQERVGKDWKIFKICKFRTMIEGADKLGPKITKGGDPRITKIGKFLRKYKLDELPQLLNVFKGDMSLVGPRPEVLRYASIYKEDYGEILKVKPGMTDIASIRFVNEEELLAGVERVEDFYLNKVLPKKIKYYKFYTRKVNFCLDIYIILNTIMSILRI